MRNEYLPRCRSAEAVFNTMGLPMSRFHGEVQNFVRRSRDFTDNHRPAPLYRVKVFLVFDLSIILTTSHRK